MRETYFGGANSSPLHIFGRKGLFWIYSNPIFGMNSCLLLIMLTKAYKHIFDGLKI